MLRKATWRYSPKFIKPLAVIPLADKSDLAFSPFSPDIIYEWRADLFRSDKALPKDPQRVIWTLRSAPWGKASRNPDLRQKLFLDAVNLGWRIFDLEMEHDFPIAQTLLSQKHCHFFFSHHEDIDSLDESSWGFMQMLQRWKTLEDEYFFKLCIRCKKSFNRTRIFRTVYHKLQTFLNDEEKKRCCLIFADLAWAPLRAGLSDFSPLSYLCARNGESLALGQLPLSHFDLLKSSSHSQSRWLGLFANPVHKSPSLYTHNRVLKQIGSCDRYGRFCIAHEDLEEALIWTQDLGFRGLSISSPFKEKVAQFMRSFNPEFCNERVISSGACNTLWRPDGEQKWRADNTDLLALQQAITQLQIGLRDPIVILGSGACAKSFASYLRTLGFSKLAVSSRKNILFDNVQNISWQELGSRLNEFCLCIQTTSLGSSQREKDYPFSFSQWPTSLALMELTNSSKPLITVSPLVDSLYFKVPTITAQEFFALQASFQFALWYQKNNDELWRQMIYGHILQIFKENACGKYLHALKGP